MIYLVQYLCHNRHCIIAAAYEDGKGETFATVQKQMLDRLKELKANPWCHICNSMTFHFEQARTKFPSMEVALPILKLAEMDNLLAREAVRKARNQ